MRELPRPVLILVVLAFVAGFVDAAVFQLVADVFVANQSGNVILFGMALGGRAGADFLSPALSLLCFVSGVAVTAAIQQRRHSRGAVQRADVAAALEVLLLVGLALAVLLLAGDGRPDSWMHRAPIIALGAIAMGSQTLLLRDVHGVAVSTTYTSGDVAQIGETAGRQLVDPVAAQAPQRKATIRILSLGIAAYATGAVIAAAGVHGTDLGAAVLMVPAAAVAGVAVALGVSGLSRRRRP